MAGNRRIFIFSLQLGLLMAGLLVWELVSRAGWISYLLFSRPTEIAGSLWRMLTTLNTYMHLGVTALETVAAFVSGSLLAVAAGFACARKPLLAAVLDPYIKVGNAMPRVVLAPLFIIWFGTGMLSKTIFGMTLVFFVVFFNTYRGVQEVDMNVVNNARMLGASPRQVFRHVVLPSVMSWILAGLHTSVGMALVGAVVGEYFAASRGLGYLIHIAEGYSDQANVFAGLAILCVFALGVDSLVTLLERRLLRWRPKS